MDTRTWDALTESMKSSYAADLKEGAVPRPVIMPLVHGQLVGLIWLRPVKTGQDALTGIASLSNIAAAAGADEVVLAWETQDVATACELPVAGSAPCLNMVHATKDEHTLHQFPYSEDVLAHGPDGWTSVEPRWQSTPAPQPGGELVPPVRAAVDYAFTPIEMDHPSPFGVTVVLMEEDGYTLHLTETFAL
ncbi:hypothetical protein [Streptomyces pseudovenezuelae]|uniref:Uncharacterized protein n=1 Tax=Streptomyces pseudovenezuelae TaxID=67350 RepID=A0ABT6LTN7_9ACTN|nr:hypothetical protein [Streptomyces pseudovenezuelae]MDH6219682.1 hypothetical protein [Streptomyces pseudovenezuelae]